MVSVDEFDFLMKGWEGLGTLMRIGKPQEAPRTP